MVDTFEYDNENLDGAESFQQQEEEFDASDLKDSTEFDFEDEEEDETKQTQKRKKVRNRKHYDIWQQFATKAGYDNFWDKEKLNWRINSSKTSRGRCVEQWKCMYHRTRKRGYNCPVTLQIVFSPYNETVTIEKPAQVEHNHDLVDRSVFTPEGKAKIVTMMEQGLQPNQIFNALEVILFNFIKKIEKVIKKKRFFYCILSNQSHFI